jgi:catechol 2,3-dioxygenase-like lactoylglutathione lyase family enzyme
VFAAVDHVVLTTRDEARCLAFYVSVLGMALERYAEGRIALRSSTQKINVHQPAVMATLKARTPTPGSPDHFLLCLCFIAAVPLDEVIERLRLRDVPIVAGPVVRTGAVGAIRTGAVGHSHRRHGRHPLGLYARSGPEPGRDGGAGAMTLRALPIQPKGLALRACGAATARANTPITAASRACSGFVAKPLWGRVTMCDCRHVRCAPRRSFEFVSNALEAVVGAGGAQGCR